MAAMLHAITVPRIGGDTMWANMAAAYDELSAPMQAVETAGVTEPVAVALQLEKARVSMAGQRPVHSTGSASCQPADLGKRSSEHRR